MVTGSRHPELTPRIASLKMLPDNFSAVSGAELPNQFGGRYGREDQHARKARDQISGWTECFPLVVREAALVVEALERAEPISLARSGARF